EGDPESLSPPGRGRGEGATRRVTGPTLTLPAPSLEGAGDPESLSPPGRGWGEGATPRVGCVTLTLPSPSLEGEGDPESLSPRGRGRGEGETPRVDCPTLTLPSPSREGEGHVAAAHHLDGHGDLARAAIGAGVQHHVDAGDIARPHGALE